jgi:hypothetical protein
MAQGIGCQTLDLTPACVNLRLYAGDANTFAVEITDEGTLVDVTGWEFQAQARKAAPDAAAAATAVCTVLDGPNGRVEVAWGDLRTLLGTDPSWSGVWDFQATPTGASLPRTLLAGTLLATLDVTRVTP